MLYQTTITQKGQIVIPVNIRRILGLIPNQKIMLEVDQEKQEATLKPTQDILDIAGTYKPKKIISALKAREKFEKEYERF